MFAAPPPPDAPPAITAAQQSDLECLSIGSVLANATHSGIPPGAASACTFPAA